MKRVILTVLFSMLFVLVANVVYAQDSTSVAYSPPKEITDAMYVIDQARSRFREDATDFINAIDDETIFLLSAFAKREVGTGLVGIFGVIVVIACGVGGINAIDRWTKKEEELRYGGINYGERMFSKVIIGVAACAIAMVIIGAGQPIQRMIAPEAYVAESVMHMIHPQSNCDCH